MSQQWASFPAPAYPWNADDWHESRLNEQDFWQWFAREKGNLVAMRCWEMYWDYENISEEEWAAGRRPREAFAECPDVVHVWMAATNVDEEYDGLVVEAALVREVTATYEMLAGEYDALAEVAVLAGRVGLLGEARGIATEIRQLEIAVDDIALGVRHLWKKRRSQTYGIPMDGWHDDFTQSEWPRVEAAKP